MNNDYPDKDFPWSFYFNGELMPKWGACWGMAGVASFLQPEQDVGQRDTYIIYCKIDHVGVVESADPDGFIYGIQEVLHIFLSQRDTVFATLAEQPGDVYSGLVEAAFRMREIADRLCCAFWTSGYETDRLRLVEVMRRCQLPSDSPEFTLPPHVLRLRHELKAARELQVRRLHQLAQAGQLDKDLRKRLYEIRAT